MKLQDAFNVINVRNQVELPQIVVVGSQSTGKSSVLESIVGKDFLPRGQGIVTRCPLVLQLRRVDTNSKDIINGQKSAAEYGEFLHRKGEKYYDFNKIREEIEEQTSRIAGGDKNISDQPISLTIYSPNVVDLTLVDLPGITKVPIKGQPHDIEDQIKKITYKYISQQNALILALTAANTDLANSDALKMAREVDPQGERTIGVVTKIDLMDQGTDALDLLQGKIYNLKLGYYGIKCRSQKQIEARMSIKEAWEVEREFFEKHPIYQSYSDQLGVHHLSRSLNKILCAHILKCIPSLSKQINELLQHKEMELAQFDLENVSISQDKGPLVLNLINRFTNSYGDMIEGKFIKESAVECLGGSRINFIFHNMFVKSIKDIDPFQYLSEQDIQTAIKNAQALSPSLFVPEVAFEVLIRQQIARLLEPSLECAHKVYKELREIVNKIELPEVNRYQRLKYKICDVMESVLDKCLTPTTEMIVNLIEIENAHINTNHPDFVGSADTLLNLFQGDQEASQNDELFEQKPQAISLLNSKNKNAQKSKSPMGSQTKLNFKEESKNQVAMSQQITKSNKQQRSQSKHEEEEKTQENKGGIFGRLLGRNDKQDSNLMKSQIINEDSDEEDDNINHKNQQMHKNKGKQRDNEFEILHNQFIDSQQYDRSNLPPIILPQIPHKMRACPAQENSRVIMETIIIQNLIQSYFTIVKKNIADLVPKTVMAFLVNQSREIAQRELVCDIYKLANLEELLVEDPLVAQAREQRRKEIVALRTAQSCLSEATQFKF